MLNSSTVLSFPRTRLFALAAGLVALLAACQVDTLVTVTMEDDGSGSVEVAVGLDDDAMARVPNPNGNGEGAEANLVELVRTADLEAAGWELAGPDQSDGVTWLRLIKPFGTPEEATEILSELAQGEVLSGMEVSRSTSFGTDRYEISGTADLSGGLEALADEGLAQVLDGQPLGESPEAMEARFGQPVEDMFELVVRADLPGDGGDEWVLELGEAPVDLESSSTVYNLPVFVLAGVALLCALGLGGFFVLRTLRSSRQQA